VEPISSPAKIRRAQTRAARLVVLTALSALAGQAAAGAFEQPPAYSPVAALGAAWKGPNYTVLSPVSSDGILRHFAFRTPYGDFEATGDQLMAARLKELAALQALSGTDRTQKLGESVAKAGMAPVVFAGNLITNPVGTTKSTAAGVSQFFSGIGSGLDNMGKSRDDMVSSISGEAKQKREIAAKLGVDPYTDFKPLADRLQELGSTAAIGNLAVAGAFMVVPGGIGVVVSDTSTVSTLNGMAADYSSAQLMDLNRDKLARLGVDRSIADSLFANRFYTPIDATAMVEALGTIGPVRNVSDMLASAATADSRATAYFIRKRIEMTAEWQRGHKSIVAFVGADNLRFPLCQEASGAIVGVFPIDSLSWTPETSRALGAITGAANGSGATTKTLVITGTATALARSSFSADGWTIEERTKF
jgi:hypothetical protein